ncbi:MAG: hypothetical protein H0U65_01385 [Rubrobacter sp.]|nr:hypothetical protein [Rubrobacter sp.]
MQRTTARNSDHETLAWLAFSMKWAESNNRPKLTHLLEFVRDEVVFEMELAEEEAALDRLKQADTG